MMPGFPSGPRTRPELNVLQIARVLTMCCCVTFGLWSPTHGADIELPSVEEIVAAHSQLRLDVRAVQGEITVYREEIPRWEVMAGGNGELDLSLQYKGRFWRSPDRFRADYARPQADRMEPCAEALDSQRLFEFVGGFPEDPDNLGMLNVYELGTPEAAAACAFTEQIFFNRIDSLWRNSDTPFAGYLQRPGSVVDSHSDPLLPEGFSIEFQNGGVEAKYRFSRDFAFGHVRIEEDPVTVERRVFSRATENGIYPTRIIDVADFGGGGGYTEVTDLQIAPLEPDSPVSHEFTVDSFRNYKTEYQVYRYDGGGQRLAERVFSGQQIPAALAPAAISDHRRNWFLRANGALIVAVSIVLCVRWAIARRRA